MKYLIGALAGLALGMSLPSIAQDSWLMKPLGEWTINAPTYLELCADAGSDGVMRCARINFGGDTVTYSGELPVVESARIFFDYVGFLKQECKK